MPDIATIKEILAKYGVPAGAAEELLSAAAKAEAKPRAVKVEAKPRPEVKNPTEPASWAQCVSLYRASKGALRFWKGAEGTALTKGAASVLIEAVKRQQAEGRKVFVPALAPELRGLALPQGELTAWAKADFALAPARAEKQPATTRAKRVKKVAGSKKAAKKQLTPAEQIAQALAALAK